MATSKTPAEKTPAKKAAARKSPAKKTAPKDKEAPTEKEATALNDEAGMPEPDLSPSELADTVLEEGGSLHVEFQARYVPPGAAAQSDIVEAEVVEDLEDPVANTIDILSATGLNTPRDAADYLVTYVQSHPDIDEAVDRKTERAALLGYQAGLQGGDAALEQFLFRHWGVSGRLKRSVGGGAHAASAPTQSPVTTNDPRRGRLARHQAVTHPKGWVPRVPPLVGPQGQAQPPAGGGLQTYEQAFEAEREAGNFQ